MRPIIELAPWEFEWASHVGTKRYIANWHKQDAQHYNKELMEDDRIADIAGCVAELAVAKFANRYWSGHAWEASSHRRNKDIADVGINIEVRRLRTRETAAVRKRQVGKGLVLFVAKPIMPKMRQVEIYGWIGYDKAWQLGVQSDYDADTRLIAPKLLRLDVL